VISYEVGSDEFLIGGAAGCDLRLPIANLPPVVCQITRKSDGVKVRRLAPGLPVLVNGHPLPSNTATGVADGDKLTVAGLDVTLSIQLAGYVAPQFTPIDPAREEPAPATPPVPSPADLGSEHRRLESRFQELEAEERARRDEWSRQDADLTRRRRELDRQTEELEEDRVLWYRRRQEMERELEQAKGLTAASPPEVARKEAELRAWEQELNRVRDELTGVREEFLRQYQERRDELSQTQEAVREGSARLQADRQAFDAEAASRRNSLDDELRARRAAFDAELAERSSRSEAEALDRHRGRLAELDRGQESLREAAAELARRREQVEAELAALRREAEAELTRRKATTTAELALAEPRLSEVREQRERLAAALQDLARQRDLFAADRDIFEKAKATFEAERAAETERLVAREEALARREAAFDQLEQHHRADVESFSRSRRELQDDLLRLDRQKAALETRESELEARTRDAESRIEQVRRDAVEWEETVLLAAAEQERLRAEAERLDRQKAELDSQTAKLAERAAQLEAQQGVLAVLRSKLDRTRSDVEREATTLTTARVREEEAQGELRARIQEAEQLRAELNVVQENAEQERHRLDERDSLLSAGLEEIRQQKDALAAEEQRLRQREAELDVRAAEFAEQAGAMKGRMAQALDLQARLEADRVAIREREAALAQAEDARQALQEQLRRRAEDLASRGKALEEHGRQLTAERALLDADRAAVTADRQATEDRVAALRQEIEGRVADAERQSAALQEREATLARQVQRVREVGTAVAAERKSLAETRAGWESERAAADAQLHSAREELDAFRIRVTTEFESLRSQTPELEEQTRAAIDRLSGARESLRVHLTELNEFARQSRDDLDAVRAEVRAEADRLREQQTTLDRARAEHRLAVTGFRQQLVEWQELVAEMKRGLSQSESRLDAKQQAVDEATRQIDATSQHLAEEADRLRRERDAVTVRRTEVERHLADMREWYRRKLRELAGADGSRSRGDETPPVLRIHDTTTPPHHPPAEDLDPGDRQLGELLRSLELVDADTLATLWAEAGRQRRTLRQVLLASGAVTLYQLALIEAGNLDGLMLGRLRVIDRLRVTTREAIYRVFDPTRTDAGRGTGVNPGVFLLRHLAEGEVHDAVHPDEFRQRFGAARDAAHPNLAAVVEVLEINGRPAVLEEWLTGLFSGDWPAHAAHPGCWVRLMTMAAAGIDAAHRAGLVHGRLTSDSFVLTADGGLKVTGFGEPPWLAVGPAAVSEPTPAADLRALGQVAFGWSQLVGKRRGARPKPFPADLLGVVRRLEADAEPPMADTVAPDRPYESAAELVADLNRIARDTPFSDDAWEKLLKHVLDNAPEAPAALRQSA
jgi:chromosome segregation ATPase